MSWVTWHAQHGVASEKTGKIKPFLAPGRLPSGTAHRLPQVGVFYRTPLYDESHTSIDGETALCGRTLIVDERWWVDSGWEEALGVTYLIVDERKTGKHGECKTKLKDLEERGKLPRPRVGAPSPFLPGEDTAMARAKAKVATMQARVLVNQFLKVFPDSEVVDGET